MSADFVLQQTGLLAFNLRLPGQYHDRETGYYYNYFRTYDPLSGRYLESDPIGLGGGWNTYAYVGGNPVMRVDPRGQSPDDVADALETAKQIFPGYPYPARIACFGTKWDDIRDAPVRGWYQYDVDEICLDQGALAPNLNCVEKAWLVMTIVHEAIHRRDYLKDPAWAMADWRKNRKRHNAKDPTERVNAEFNALKNKDGWKVRYKYCGTSSCGISSAA